MVHRRFRRLAAAGICALTLAAAAVNSVRAQSISYALGDPDYRDDAHVGRHLAYSIILGSYVSMTNFRRTPRVCQMDLAGSEFPDLVIPTLADGGIEGWRRCLDRVEDILRRDTVTQSAFAAAAADALAFRPVPPDDQRFFGANLNDTRIRMQLGLLGEQVLRQLFPNDPVLTPILNYYDWITREQGNYAGFTAWLVKHRGAERFGLYSMSGAGELRKEGNDRLRNWGFKVAAEPKFPASPRPQADTSKGMRVNVPALRGRSFLLIRCDHTRDEYCDVKIDLSFCNKGLNQLAATNRPEPAFGRATLRCSDVGTTCRLPGWLVVDSTDARATAWFKEELSAGRLHAPDVDFTLVEYAIPVSVD